MLSHLGPHSEIKLLADGFGLILLCLQGDYQTKFKSATLVLVFLTSMCRMLTTIK